jgi:hypothetical protein
MSPVGDGREYNKNNYFLHIIAVVLFVYTFPAFTFVCFRPNDFALLGDIVQSIEKICAHLGWTEDLTEIQLENELKLLAYK